MSEDPKQEYFSDGLTEDLTSNLSQISSLFVLSRNTAFTYKDKAVKLSELSRELGVRYVVEGSVRKAGDQVRITAQLIDATQDQHLWSERYDWPLTDIFALTHVPSFLVGPGGVNHLGFILEADGELGSMLIEVERCGGKIRKQGHREYGGISEQFAYIEDPDGYVIELATQAILYNYLSDKGSV